MNDQTPVRPIHFEGRSIQKVVNKVSGAMPLEDLSGQVVSIDDRVQMVGIFVVTHVGFDVDKNGELVRVQTLKPLEMHLLPFDESDPNDDGILRAMVPATATSPALSSGGGDDEE